MPPPPAPELPPALPADLLEEIFLRLPPDEPEWLVRASLASKLWLGRLTAPRFHARYSEFHRAAPMLGFFYSGRSTSEEPPFVFTTKFPVCIPSLQRDRGYSTYTAWDCRHGRLLLWGWAASPEKLVVLDPITGCRWNLVAPGFYDCYAAAVLCAVTGCDHRTCHDGPSSRVVFIGLDIHDDPRYIAYAYECLPHSDLRQWRKPCSDLYLGPNAQIEAVPPVLIKDTLYFKIMYDDDDRAGILKYDLCSKCLSVIDAPRAVDYTVTILMGMADGSLGFVHMDGLTVNLWSRQMGSDGAGSWSECKIIDLKERLSVPNKRLQPTRSVEGGDIIFVTTGLGIYEINLKSLEWKKIWKEENIRTLIPYMGFYYPQGRLNPCGAAL